MTGNPRYTFVGSINFIFKTNHRVHYPKRNKWNSYHTQCERTIEEDFSEAHWVVILDFACFIDCRYECIRPYELIRRQPTTKLLIFNVLRHSLRAAQSLSNHTSTTTQPLNTRKSPKNRLPQPSAFFAMYKLLLVGRPETKLATFEIDPRTIPLINASSDPLPLYFELSIEM